MIERNYRSSYFPHGDTTRITFMDGYQEGAPDGKTQRNPKPGYGSEYSDVVDDRHEHPGPLRQHYSQPD